MISLGSRDVHGQIFSASHLCYIIFSQAAVSVSTMTFNHIGETQNLVLFNQFIFPFSSDLSTSCYSQVVLYKYFRSSDMQVDLGSLFDRVDKKPHKTCGPDCTIHTDQPLHGIWHCKLAFDKVNIKRGCIHKSLIQSTDPVSASMYSSTINISSYKVGHGAQLFVLFILFHVHMNLSMVQHNISDNGTI